jgi:anti-sigma B factor antagonist
MSQRLQISTVHEPGADVVVVLGEVDMESSPRLLQALQHQVARSPRTVVDLAGVRYMDSAGVAVLVQGLRAAMRRGQQFVLRAPSAPVSAVLDLAQLRQLFRIEPARDGGS